MFLSSAAALGQRRCRDTANEAALRFRFPDPACALKGSAALERPSARPRPGLLKRGTPFETDESESVPCFAQPAQRMHPAFGPKSLVPATRSVTNLLLLQAS